MSADLVGPRVVLTACRTDHHQRLREIHLQPEVVRWWQLPDDGWPADPEPDTHSSTIMVDGQVAGFLQWYAEGGEEFLRAGLDLFLDPVLHGRGLGTEAVRLMCAHLVDERGFHRLVIDPEAANTAAVACYAKVGFRPVGVMRQYSRDRHGTWRDGLLMDLLAAELVRG